MLVDQAMTAQPIVAFPTTTIREVLRLMLDGHVRHLPIVEGKVLVGIVSIHDLRALIPRGLADVSHPDGVQRVLEEPVSKIMNADPITVQAKVELRKAVDLLVDHKIGALPVVEPASHKLVGILSYVDALRVARAFL
jgi:CBS domain-containing protein